MRVLITGARGQVGHELVLAFADHDVIATGHDELDVTDRQAVLAAVTAQRPAAIIPTGAWTPLGACASDPDRPFAVNAPGTPPVAAASPPARPPAPHPST